MTRREALQQKLRADQTRLATAKLPLHKRLQLQRQIDAQLHELRQIEEREKAESGTA